MNNQWFSKVAVWLVIALVLFTVFKQFDRGATQGNQIGYSDFLEEVRSKRIKSVHAAGRPGGGTEIRAITTDDKRLRSTATYLDRGLVGDLINNGVKFDVKPREEPSILMSILRQLGPDAAADRRLDLLHAPDAGRRQGRRVQLRQVARRACSTRPTTPPPSPTSPAATRPRKRSRSWSTS